jgi:hypothetical protein
MLDFFIRYGIIRYKKKTGEDQKNGKGKQGKI